MQQTKRKHVLIRSMVLMMALLAGCMPAASPAATLPTASETASPVSPTLTQTETSTVTPLPTGSPTVTLTPEPSATPVFPPHVVAQPTRTRRPPRQNTATPLPTATLTATSTPPSPTHCPMATSEPFYVEPVTSPTDQLSQVVTVYIGHGEQVTIITESGTFIDTTSPFQVEVTLLPNTVHHLEVRGKVKEVWTNGCRYGGYTLSTTRDGYGAPLTIVQGTSYP